MSFEDEFPKKEFKPKVVQKTEEVIQKVVKCICNAVERNTSCPIHA